MWLRHKSHQLILKTNSYLALFVRYTITHIGTMLASCQSDPSGQFDSNGESEF